ncbi:MAG: hypothetical protein JXN61_18835, partial [Sedimentisphaerales bacterium]|nr:hypothetical protein [Sedimentisphaerales bacterium]
MRLRVLLYAIVICIGVALPAAGATITFTGIGLDLNGQGFGHFPPILTLKPHANATTEWGEVFWDGISDVLTGDAEKNKSETITAGGLLDEGVTLDNFGLIFNINEPGSKEDLNLFQFSVDFFTASGTEILSAEFDGGSTGLNLEGYDHGQGKAGWLFAINL